MPLSVSSVQTVANTPTLDKSEDSSETKTELDPFPEGGTAAWCAVFGAVLMQLCSYGYTMSFGVYQDYYTLHYLTNESSSTISWIGSVNAFLVTACSGFAGMLHDRGYFYHLIIGGSLLESIALFILSLTRPGQYYQIFLAQGIALGIAQGCLYVPSVVVVSQYFCRRRTLAMSLVSSGSSIGAIIHPIMLNYLFKSVGFANGVRISAAFVGGLLLVACLLMRTRLEPPKSHINYLSVGKDIIRDIPFCLMSVGLLLFELGLFFPLFYLQLDSVKHGNSEIFSFYSLALLNGGSLIGRLTAGFIATYVGVPMLMIISTAICGILVLGMIGLSTTPTVVVLGAISGYFSGICVAMFSPLIAHLTLNFSELGARIGIVLATVGFGTLFAGPVSGALLTSQYKWWQPALFIGLITLVGSLLLVVMQLLRTRSRMRSTEGREP